MSTAKPLIIVGAGGHGRVALDVAQAAFASTGERIAGFLDDSAQGKIDGTAVIGPLQSLAETLPAHRFIVAIGHQKARRALSRRILEGGGELATIVHPTAWVSPRAQIGRGTILVGGVTVNTGAVIGDFCILNTGCSVDHDNHLADGVQVCPGARLAGNVRCGEDVFVGTGAVIIPGCTIGADVVIGAGAIVIRDAPAGTWVGNPAGATQSTASVG